MEYIECDKCGKKFCRHDPDTFGDWVIIKGVLDYLESEIHLCKKHHKELQKIFLDWRKENNRYGY
jgi:hypothetical protein